MNGVVDTGLDADTPLLALGGFNGSLALLLQQARAHRIDLIGLSWPELLGQLSVALDQTVPLSRKADWVVMAAWLLQLRSRLLLPITAEAERQEDDAEQPCEPQMAPPFIQALAVWLRDKPQLGRDVFARGQPEFIGVSATPAFEVDVVEFLWAAMVLFDDDLADADTTIRYRPPQIDLFSIAEARDRILARLAETEVPQPLPQLLPVMAESATQLRRRSAWTSTFTASLELAKQGQVTLAQEDRSATIQICATTEKADPPLRYGMPTFYQISIISNGYVSGVEFLTL
jgi:segregation and condensation protein A